MIIGIISYLPMDKNVRQKRLEAASPKSYDKYLKVMNERI